MLSSNIIAAFDWSSTLGTVGVVLKVAIGLGAVIFVHELGHFLVAKLCGVKIEKFMIGFDIGGYKLSWRRGETVYGIGILPLGGYVKMLGQDDDPAHIAEQMKKSQVEAHAADAVPIQGPDGATYYVDRRSYLAKSVPQRMAIISAGVVMNIIFAFIFAVVAYGMGVPYMPSIVSETTPGGPAWQAGLKPGDEIVQLGKYHDPTFMQLMGGVTLGDMEHGIPVTVRRASNGELEHIQLKPRQREGHVAMIGVMSPVSLTLLEEMPVNENSPAAQAKLVESSAGSTNGDDAHLQGGDKIVQVGEKPVSAYREFAAELAQRPDKRLTIIVERPAGHAKHGSAAKAGAASQKRLTFEVPAAHLRDFGLVMKIGPITAIRLHSPAEAAGLKVGDRIETVDGKPAGAGNWTPDTLPDLLRQAATEHREVELGVERVKDQSGEGKLVHVRVTPRLPTMYYTDLPLGMPQGAEALGIAYDVTNEVQAVVSGGPAADSGIKPGDRLATARIVYPQDKNGKALPPAEVKLDGDAQNWPALVQSIQYVPPETFVKLTVSAPGDKTSREVKIVPGAVEAAFFPPRGFIFQPIKRIRKAATFAEQIRYGWDETADSLTMVVRFLKKLGTQQVPLSALGGPVTIAKAAGHS
ncbi:MAG TPA: site-2 protease family protein, partial [Lacipirellulaceae bacterium]|nr:site-2 protease family protein [Lacipirellulaceae bacterium]